MWVVLFGFGTFFLNYATLVPVGEGMGLTTVTAGSILTIMMVAVVGVQPVASMLNSRFGPRHALGIALILQGISNIVGLVDGSPIAVLLTASIIGGLGFGVLVVSGTAVVPSTVVPSRLGRALGYFGATTAGATALGPDWSLAYRSYTTCWFALGRLCVDCGGITCVIAYSQNTAKPRKFCIRILN